jgi:peptide/nickel transport system substrate-binding protein
VTLGFSRVTRSIVPRDFDFAGPTPPHAYDPRRAKQLRAEAGYPQGFDAGDITTDLTFSESAEAAVNYLGAVGIGTRLRIVERATPVYFAPREEPRPFVYLANGAYGNAATRLEAFVAASGVYTYGSYPDIEGLIQEQSVERDGKRREATLHRIQQLVHERALFAPIYEVASLSGHGPRVAEPGLGLIAGYLFAAPYEEIKLKGR